MLIHIANELKLGDNEITGFENMPQIGGDQELIAAVILQNLQHPKNHHRREAVVAKQYQEILTPVQGKAYLSKLLTMHLKNELAGRETQLRVQMSASASTQSAGTFLDAPDIYFAAAIMVQDGFYLGKGDRTILVHMIRKAGNSCLAIPDKLALIQQTKFQGVKLFKDKFKDLPKEVNISRHERFQLWLSLVRQKKALTNEEFMRVFPMSAENAKVWDYCIDEDGKPYKEYHKYIKFREFIA